MKKVFKGLGILLAILIIVIAIFYFKNNESLPNGVQGKKADDLANKMLIALNIDAYNETELLEWSFRDSHQYKWNKAENTVIVSWKKNKVLIDTKNNKNSKVISSNNGLEQEKLIKTATDFFNNDSFWLVAPYKIFDKGVERRIVKHNNKDALLITYTTGGSTPGDSYLWILDENNFPLSYKMWVSIIPIGGIEATWDQWTKTDAGIQLPSSHTINLFNMKLGMGNVKATNPKADSFANKILKAISHDAYKNTRYLEWSFGGRRTFKWDKKNHIIDVSWGENKVVLHPNNISKSILYINNNETTKNKGKLVKRANDIFNNDSFWLVAPHKLFEPGIIRSIVNIEGNNALKVKYTTGGTTPGDSYIWLVDKNYVPVKYLMNVPSMKMNQVPATWDDWITTKSGALLPKNHTFSGGRKLSMGDVKGYN